MTRSLRLARTVVLATTVWAVAMAIFTPRIDGHAVLAISLTALSAILIGAVR